MQDDSMTDYEANAHTDSVLEFEQQLERGLRRPIAAMSIDEKLTELLWILRRGETEAINMVMSAKDNPMLSMLFPK